MWYGLGCQLENLKGSVLMPLLVLTGGAYPVRMICVFVPIEGSPDVRELHKPWILKTGIISV